MISMFEDVLVEWRFRCFVCVQVIEKNGRKSRSKVLKEIEICHHCQGHPNILQINEYFEEDERFVNCSTTPTVYSLSKWVFI